MPTRQWTPPEDVPGLSVGALFRGGLRLYRQAFEAMIAVAVLQQAVQLVLLIPSFVIAARVFARFLDVFDIVRSSAYVANPRLFQVVIQARLQDAMQPARDLAVVAQLVAGLGVVVAVVAWELLTAIALAERDPSIIAALRTIVRRASSFVLPAVLFVAGWTLLSLPIAVAQPSMEEGIGLRAGLARSSALTRGVRLRIALALIVLWILVALIALVPVAAALIVGLAAGSIVAGVVLGGLGLFVVVLLSVPLTPSMLVVAYRERVERERPAAT